MMFRWTIKICTIQPAEFPPKIAWLFGECIRRHLGSHISNRKWRCSLTYGILNFIRIYLDRTAIVLSTSCMNEASMAVTAFFSNRIGFVYEH